LGYDIEKLLEGAGLLRESFFSKEEDTLCRKAFYYALNHEEIPINVLFSYSSAFKYFNDWYVQLWGESLGKINIDGTKVGLTPIGIIGSVDQHSFLQLIIEGAGDKSVTMIKVKNFANDITIPDISLPYLEKNDFINTHSFTELINAQCDATMQSIIDQNISVDTIEIEKLDEMSAGYMIFYYELLTSLVGNLLRVNTYDQPGVELGKVILKKKFES
jgi:glucose-6-phosphate isomerase